MQLTTNNAPIDVEALKSQILSEKSTTERFRSIHDTRTTAYILLSAYKAEVEHRHGTFNLTQEVRDNILKMATAITKPTPRQGIILCGKYGTGKTTLLYAFRSALKYLDGSGEDYTKGGTITIADARDIANMAQRDYQQFRKLCLEKMLAIEDMGKEPREVLSFGNSCSPIIDMLERRYNRQLFTIITTNMDVEDIGKEEYYGKRVGDRVKEMFDSIAFNAESFRK